MSRRILGLEQAEWSFWTAWVAFSVAAAAVAGIVTLPLGARWSISHLTGVSEGSLPSFVFGAVGAGAIIGTGQWLVLRKVAQQAGWWVLASALTAVVVVAVGEAVVPTPEGKMTSFPFRHVVGTAIPHEAVLLNFVLGAVTGAITGTGQWLILRKRVQQAGLWVLASAAGWAVANTVHGALYSAITGFVLVLLLRWPIQSGDPAPET